MLYWNSKDRKSMSKILLVNSRLYLLLLAFQLLTIAAIAQPALSTKNKKAIALYTEADNYRVRGQFPEAISLLKQAIEKDNDFVEAYYRLGITYMTIKRYEEATSVFEQGLAKTADEKKQKVFWFDLGETYFNRGEYQKADSLISAFLKAETVNRSRIEYAKKLKANIDFAAQNQATAAAYKQKPLSDTVNAFAKQYFPVLTADQSSLIFTRREGHTDNFDEDLVVSFKDRRGRWTSPQSISKNINSMYNEGTCTISADGRKLIFTSCTGRDNLGSCDLFESHKTGDEWSVPENLGPFVNSTEWESQPSLSADGRTLYFISDRRGGIGRRDIWVSTLDNKGEWTRAKNIGKPINTVYDEISPFIHVNNRTLYFASNGQTGFGGYDIFFSELDSSKWTAPKNIGPPINNHEDQFSLFITADGKKGYYSHEETTTGINASSRIYELEFPKESQVRYRSNYVKGVIRDSKTRAPLAATVELISIETNRTESLVESDSITGEYLIVLTQGAEYALYVSKENYVFKSLNFNYSDVTDFEPIILDIYLDPIAEGSTVVLENLFFDTDRYELKPKSLSELQKITRFLNENPNTRIEIGGHTDNVGNPSYNRELSEKRANSVYQYLIQQKISPKRLLAKGYGAQKPVASNENEIGRRQNRRIEFKLIK